MIEQPNNLEFKNLSFSSELKIDESSGQKRFYIEGYAAVFGNKDSYGDIVENGAFTETIINDAKRIKFCFNHNLYDGVCGKVLELSEDSKGLLFKAEIIPTSVGSDLIKLIEFGAIDEMSIGYRTQEFKDESPGTVDAVRRLIKVSLIEISAVSRAANPEATITTSERKAEQFNADLKSATYEQLVKMSHKIANEQAQRIINNLKF